MQPLHFVGGEHMIKKILAICLIVFVLCSCSKMPTDLSSEENKSTMSEIEYTQETETQNTDISDNTDTEIITEEKKTSIYIPMYRFTSSSR